MQAASSEGMPRMSPMGQRGVPDSLPAVTFVVVAQEDETGEVPLPRAQTLPKNRRTTMLLPSGRLLMMSARLTSTVCLALAGEELVGRTVLLDYPAVLGFSDDEVIAFFDNLHHLQLYGGVFGVPGWYPNWYYLADALRCTGIVAAGSAMLRNVIQQAQLEPEYMWPWLNVARLPSFLLPDQPIEFLVGLPEASLRRFIGPEHRDLVIQNMSTIEILHFALRKFSQKNLLCCEVVSRGLLKSSARLVWPQPQGLQVQHVKFAVEEMFGIPCNQQHWSYRETRQVSQAAHASSHANRASFRANRATTPQFEIITETLQDDSNLHDKESVKISRSTPVLRSVFELGLRAVSSPASHTIVLDGVQHLPENARLVIVVSSKLTLVCHADLLLSTSRLLVEMINEDDNGRSAPEIPLPHAAQYLRSEVIEFFQRLHNKTLQTDDRCWLPSWVHLVHFLQMDELMERAARYTWQQIQSGSCCQTADHFWSCVDASRLQMIQARCPPAARRTATPADLADFLLSLQPFLLARLIYSDRHRNITIEQLGDLCGPTFLQCVFQSKPQSS